MVRSDYLRDARVVVVGAGIIGSAIAYRLAQAGGRVTIVERRRPAAGTSGATFAWLNGVDKPPKAYHRMSVLGLRDAEDLADELGHVRVRATGSLHWAYRADAAHAVALARSMRQLVDWGMRVDRLSPAEVISDIEPDLRIDPDAVEAVWLVARSGWVDPVALATGAVRAAVERYGARFVTAEVTAMARAGTTIEAVVLGDGSRLEADVVVNAAGPEADRMAALAGASLPIERTPGILVATAPAPIRLSRVVCAQGLNVRPDGGSRLLIQREALDSDVTDGVPIALDDPRIGAVVEAARRILPGLEGVRAEGVRLGVRPVPKDGFPIVGFDPAVLNLYHAVTHSGVTLAARLALLVAEELTGGDTAPLEPYRPARFPAAGPA